MMKKIMTAVKQIFSTPLVFVFSMWGDIIGRAIAKEYINNNILTPGQSAMCVLLFSLFGVVVSAAMGFFISTDLDSLIQKKKMRILSKVAVGICSFFLYLMIFGFVNSTGYGNKVAIKSTKQITSTDAPIEQIKRPEKSNATGATSEYYSKLSNEELLKRLEDSYTSNEPGAVSKAYEQGDAKAQFNLGAMYYEGKEVPINYTEAFKW